MNPQPAWFRFLALPTLLLGASACGDSDSEGSDDSGGASFLGVAGNLVCQGEGRTSYSGKATLTLDGKKHEVPLPTRFSGSTELQVYAVCQSEDDASSGLNVDFRFSLSDALDDHGIEDGPATFTAKTAAREEELAEQDYLAVSSFGIFVTAFAPYAEDLAEEDRYQSWGIQYSDPRLSPDEDVQDAPTWTDDFEVTVDFYERIEGGGGRADTHGTVGSVELVPVRYKNDAGETCSYIKDCEHEAGRKPLEISVEF